MHSSLVRRLTQDGELEVRIIEKPFFQLCLDFENTKENDFLYFIYLVSHMENSKQIWL